MSTKHLLHASVSLLLVFAALAPWGTVFFMPEEAFAQTGTITGAATIPSASASPALRNQAAQQGGQVSWSQAAASGAVSIGACLAAAGISIGAGIAAIGAALGITSLAGAGAGAGAALSGAGAGAGAALSGASVALTVPVNDLLTHVELIKLNAVTASILAVQTKQLIQIGSMNAKESMLDCIAWALAKMIWRAVAASIIDWINGGFNGRPAFIQDFQRFFLGVVDRAIGEVIQSDQYLAFLCSPFQLNIRIALAMRYAQRAPTCSLTQIIANVENFARSFQSGGGWPAWLQFTVTPVDNPYAGYLTSEAVISFTYQSKLRTETFERGISSGFLSQKKQVNCKAGEKPGQGSCREIIVTPGELIAQQASQVIGSGNTQLLLADEFNEIIDALVVQLLGKALNSLFSLSDSSAYQDDYYRGTSFTGELSGASSVEANVSLENGSLIEQIDAAIGREQELQYLYNQAIQVIENAKSQVYQVSLCWHGKEAGTSTPVVADSGDRVQAGIQGRTNDGTITAIERKKDPFRSAIAQGDRNIAALNTLIQRASSAANQAELDLVLRDFNGMLSTGDFAQASDTVRANSEIATLNQEMSSYQTSASLDLERCQYFPLPPPNPFQSLFESPVPPTQ